MDTNNIVDKPYPEIVDASYSPETVYIIKNLYASRNSEFTAVANYSYQDFVVKAKYPDVANLLEEIGITEMKHLELLADAIIEFGGDPTFTSGRGQPWNTLFSDREKNVCRILQNDIRAETRAIAEYSNSAVKVSNSSLSNLFLRIAEDEQLHKKLLEQTLTSFQECN